MNKGIKYTLLTLVAAAAVGTGAYFAFGAGSEAYLNIIPKDAKAVAKIGSNTPVEIRA